MNYSVREQGIIRVFMADDCYYFNRQVQCQEQSNCFLPVADVYFVVQKKRTPSVFMSVR